MTDAVHDDVQRALEAFGGENFNYRTFNTFALRPRCSKPAAAQPTSSAAPVAVGQAAAPAIRPLIPVTPRPPAPALEAAHGTDDPVPLDNFSQPAVATRPSSMVSLVVAPVVAPVPAPVATPATGPVSRFAAPRPAANRPPAARVPWQAAHEAPLGLGLAGWSRTAEPAPADRRAARLAASVPREDLEMPGERELFRRL